MIFWLWSSQAKSFVCISLRNLSILASYKILVLGRPDAKKGLEKLSFLATLHAIPTVEPK